MNKEPVIKNFTFSGSLSDVCADFVKEKRSLGCLYNAEAGRLSEFSKFTERFELSPNTLTEEVVKAWIKRRPNDSDRNYYSRYSLIKLLAEYMLRLGYEAYLPVKDEIQKVRGKYIPYIFTHQEIHAFFATADNMQRKHRTTSPRKHIMMPQIFRLLYCCGLRVSEAIVLRNDDVDLINGILTIKDSKFGKSRYVPLSKEVTQSLKQYTQKSIHSPFFFPSPEGGHYAPQTIYSVFRDLLWMAGISHGGSGKGPRLHDFRHTFAVHCLEKWSKSSISLSAALPRLSAYLGHEGLKSTEHYLRMTAEMYPEISKLLSERYGYIVSRGGVSE